MERDDPNLDWDVDGATDAPAEERSKGMSKQSLPRKETLMETLTETLHDETLAEAAVGLASQDVVQLLLIYTPHLQCITTGNSSSE